MRTRAPPDHACAVCLLYQRLIEMALEVLGLQECRGYVCDPALGERLSGGQMRRIGIGIELVCDPPIMLLDEPTSALDAVNTRLVVSALKSLTERGVLVIASLHQPRQSVYNMFDKLWLMRKGELAYGGPVTTGAAYFAFLGYPLPEGNPADFFSARREDRTRACALVAIGPTVRLGSNPLQPYIACCASPC